MNAILFRDVLRRNKNSGPEEKKFLKWLEQKVDEGLNYFNYTLDISFRAPMEEVFKEWNQANEDKEKGGVELDFGDSTKGVNAKLRSGKKLSELTKEERATVLNWKINGQKTVQYT